MPHTLSLLLVESARPVRANSDNIRSNALTRAFGTATACLATFFVAIQRISLRVVCGDAVTR
jgi:hypothetical protein